MANMHARRSYCVSVLLGFPAKLVHVARRFWRDQRGLTVTPEAGIWLVIGLGTATLVTFALSGGIRGLAARVLDAINGVNPGS